MKKTIIFIAVMCILASITLVGCESFTRQIVEAVNLPDQYLIEYEVINEDNTVSTIVKGKDANGSYYYKESGKEILYVYDGEYYTVYELTDGVWVAGNDKVDEQYISDATKVFDEYCGKSREKFNGAYKQGENSVVLGRDCETYSLSLDILNFDQNYEMTVDSESGVCMSFYGVSSVNSNETNKVGFECTKFETIGVDFSDLIK